MTANRKDLHNFTRPITFTTQIFGPYFYIVSKTIEKGEVKRTLMQEN